MVADQTPLNSRHLCLMMLLMWGCLAMEIHSRTLPHSHSKLNSWGGGKRGLKLTCGESCNAYHEPRLFIDGPTAVIYFIHEILLPRALQYIS